MNTKIYSCLVALAFMASFSMSIQAKEPSEYTDRELLNAGWSQEQIDDLKGRVSKAPPPPPPPKPSTSYSINSKDDAISYLNNYSCSSNDSLGEERINFANATYINCLLYTSPSPRDKRQSRMPSSA